MHGRRSLSLELIPFNPEPERILRSNTPTVTMGDEVPTARPMKEYFTPSTYTTASCIRIPSTNAAQYEIKSSMIQLLPSFHGLTNEDPYKHLEEFLEVCSTMKIKDFSTDAQKLVLFPFSLKDKAKHWLGTLNVIVQTWDQMQKEFLKKYYPIGRTNQMRRAITNFSQIPGELFHDTWERLRDLLRKCPHHAVPKWQLVQSFYDSLSESHRQMVDASCGGTFMTKSEDEAWDLFELLSDNSMHHASVSRTTPTLLKKSDVHEIGHSIDIHSKLELITQKLDQVLSVGQGQLPSSTPPIIQEVCSLCVNPNHYVNECPMSAQYSEQVQVAQAVSRPTNDPFSNTYNPGWKNHPNFSWRPQSQTSQNFSQSQSFRAPFQNQAQPNAYSGVQPPVPPYQSNPSFEDKVLQSLKNLEMLTQTVNSHTQSIANLETRVGQLADTISRREQGTLPSQTVENPRGQLDPSQTRLPNQFHEQVKSVTTLRSGHVLEHPHELKKDNTEASQPLSSNLENEVSPIEKMKHKDDVPASYIPKAPFPAALAANTPPFSKKGTRMDEMLDLFKQVQINLPLLDAIKQVPSYAKFLKDLCTQKRKMRTNIPKKIMLTEHVSAVLTNQLPPKLKDPGAPIISCVIGDITIERALLDLGASVNLLPSSVYDRFPFGNLKPTPVTLQFADRSEKIPRGLIEDVLVKVEEFYFPVDFIVLDMESTHNPSHSPIILGRPFLATANACINCRSGAMDLSFGNKKIRLNIFNVVQEHDRVKECFAINSIQNSVEETSHHLCTKKSMPYSTLGKLRLEPLCVEPDYTNQSFEEIFHDELSFLQESINAEFVSQKSLDLISTFDISFEEIFADELRFLSEHDENICLKNNEIRVLINNNENSFDIKEVNFILKFWLETKRKKSKKKIRKVKCKFDNFIVKMKERLSILKSPLKKTHWESGKRSRGRNR